MASLGSFGTPREVVEVVDTFDYFGSEIRVSPEFGELDLADFMEAAAGLDEDSVDALSLVKRTMRSAVHAEDFDTFWRLAKANRQGTEDLMPVLYACVEAVAERPTQRPSDSSDGPSATRALSAVDSSSQVIGRLEGNGRPDLALMAHMATEAREASAASA